ncbi:hypothetical protein ZIOFF_031851 [Zingiber officinale]|uniref:Aspergillus nuclease S1 n=2 Tax=Zingiber officinale TaxID=94328 RepID=A0A8J5LAA6_ZINOF|nr:hypothetical protein ZIOFF_031851 [Zingiber officinale]
MGKRAEELDIDNLLDEIPHLRHRGVLDRPDGAGFRIADELPTSVLHGDGGGCIWSEGVPSSLAERSLPLEETLLLQNLGAAWYASFFLCFLCFCFHYMPKCHNHQITEMGFYFNSHTLASFFLLLAFPAFTYGWGIVGHQIICQITQDRLSESAAAAVKELLPAYAENDLSTLCSWADTIKFRYHWSSELHYIDTPDDLCTYNYNRDCKDEDGVKGRCVSGAITNYTNQLLTYGSSADESQYNLTEALLFLSHLMGDIHQPLHVGFTSDRGGNTIPVRWFRRKSELHKVWDKDIIETAGDRFYDNVVEEFLDALKQNITGEWSDQVVKWEKCSNNKVACPDVWDRKPNINLTSGDNSVLYDHDLQSYALFDGDGHQVPQDLVEKVGKVFETILEEANKLRYETNEDMSIAQAIKLVEFEGLGELRSKDEEDEGLGELRSKDEEDEGI